MAQMYNPKNGKETRGESLVYDKFKSLLPDDYLVLHNQIMPGKDREIDFIAIHPTFGVWVIEVKDWAMDQVRVIDTDQIELKKGGLLGLGRTSIERNPLKQARDNLIYLKESFQKHTNLLHQEGDHKGKLLVPINSFAIFANISRAEIEQSGVSDFFPVNKVWTKDLLEDPYIQEDQFERALRDAREVKFQCNLSDTQLNSIKRCAGVAAVVPNISSPDDGSSTTDEDIGTLDEYQNRLIRSKLESQIAIEGPAGSGKSIVLLQRAIHIHREFPHWRIGIVCFNALMANYMRAMLSREKDAEALAIAIDVYDIYDWVKQVGLRSRNVSGLMNDQALKDALDSAEWKLDVQYDALLIDEGQDATDTLLQLYRAMLLQDDCSFTFFYDGRQILYQGSVANKLKAYGFDVEEKNLVRQQRSSLVILALAFYRRVHDKEDFDQAVDGSVEIAGKWFGGFLRWASDKLKTAIATVRAIWRSGIAGIRKRPEIIDLGKELADACEVIACVDSNDLAEAIARRVLSAIESKEFSYGEIAILFPNHHYAPGISDSSKGQLRRLVTDKCRNERIPYTCIEYDNGHVFDGTERSSFADNRRTANLQSNTVKLMTVHTSKGFDSKLVLIAGFDGIERSEFKAQLGYVALTRAKKRCEVYYCKKTECVSDLEKLLALLKERKLELTG